MPLPIAHALVGASIVALTLPDASPTRNWKPLLIGGALSVCPDLDYFFGTTWHRGFTHSLAFACAVSAVCLAAMGFAKVRVAIAYAGAFFSHGLLDYATTKAMPGVELLWPMSNRRFGLGLIDYYQITGIDPVYFLFKDVAADLLKAGMIELMIFVPVFVCALLLKWGLNRLSNS